MKPGKYFVIRPLENEILDEGEDIEGGSELGGREEAERAMDSRPAAIIEVNLRSGVVMWDLKYIYRDGYVVKMKVRWSLVGAKKYKWRLKKWR